MGEELIFIGCGEGLVRCFSPHTLQVRGHHDHLDDDDDGDDDDDENDYMDDKKMMMACITMGGSCQMLLSTYTSGKG